MPKNILTLTYAVERDIDLIVIEELACNQQFRIWILDRLNIDSSTISSAKVLHSWRRTENRREIDIYLECHLENGARGLVLIENKLDTDPQPQQGESYQEECQVLLSQPDVSFAHSVLMAPQHYLTEKADFNSKFDTAISYQDIAAMLTAQASTLEGELRLRLKHRTGLFEQAINKSRRPYEKIINRKNSSFHDEYWSFAKTFDPRFVSNSTNKDEDKKVPSESVSMIFNLSQSLGPLAKRLGISRFSHELGNGKNHRTHYVAVTFKGRGAQYLENRERFDEFLKRTPYQFSSKSPSKSRPNPGLTLFVETPEINGQQDLHSQLSKIESGLQQAVAMMAWLKENEPDLASLLGMGP